ncbi:MAG: PEP/pyruvate-binding domain-containing protein [Candidatus Neomarinimicrobiota bacterium]
MSRSKAETVQRLQYHDLMLYRVHEILLVSSPYDAYILEEDGRLTEQILTEYLGMNLSYAPRVWRASTAGVAMTLLSERKFDLVITLLRIPDMDPVTFGTKVKEKYPRIPVVLLIYDTSELLPLQSQLHEEAIDKVFVWSGNSNVFPVIIKYVEDKLNVVRDIEKGDVRVIIVVEDNPRYYSIILPRIYSEVLYLTRKLMDKSLNDTHRLLRLRARPKILLSSTFEEAQENVEICKDNLLGIISDVRFPRDGKLDDNAGFELAKWVRERDEHLPFLIQSTHADAELKVRELDAEFLNKRSRTMLQDLGDFVRENFGFGDFVFRYESGEEAARASTLLELEGCLASAPEASIISHATKNHFSNWLAARGEFWIASRMRHVEVSDFDTPDDLRAYLIEAIDTTRSVRHAGRVVDYTYASIDPTATFLRVRGGSLGGKARGLAFANSLVSEENLNKRFPDVEIHIPRVVAIGTDEFEDFLRNDDLLDFALQTSDPEELRKRFLAANLSKELTKFLKSYLKDIKTPIAVRSSGLLEDMQYHSLAGIYGTYMLSNSSKSLSSRLENLCNAIKLVYASTFSEEAKSTVDASGHRLEDEKMAVIVQELVGQTYGSRFYPTFSGMTRSLNYYPVSYMKREEGIAYTALGLGKMITEGGRVLCFSPEYPSILPQFYSPEVMLENSQREFYALDLNKDDSILDGIEEGNIVKYALKEAEEDGSLRHVGSVLTSEDNIVRDSLRYKGARLVTFANVLKMNSYPLAGILRELLKMGYQALGCAVEFEFACNIFKDPERKPEFCLLQIRPMAVDTLHQEINIETLSRDQLVCQSALALGNGFIEDIEDIIYVRPEVFDPGKSRTMASQVGDFNKEMPSGRRYLLIGPGRWGSADPWLGIPVGWGQISRSKVIIEVGSKDLRIDPSFGGHFFQNVTSFNLGYLTIGYRDRRDFVDWEWLESLPPYRDSPFVKWVRLDEPLSIWIDGRSGDAVVAKPHARDQISKGNDGNS